MNEERMMEVKMKHWILEAQETLAKEANQRSEDRQIKFQSFLKAKREQDELKKLGKGYMDNMIQKPTKNHHDIRLKLMDLAMNRLGYEVPLWNLASKLSDEDRKELAENLKGLNYSDIALAYRALKEPLGLEDEPLIIPEAEINRRVKKIEEELKRDKANAKVPCKECLNFHGLPRLTDIIARELFNENAKPFSGLEAWLFPKGGK